MQLPAFFLVVHKGNIELWQLLLDIGQPEEQLPFALDASLCSSSD